MNRYLIVNADDFGISSGVNAGIICSYENGILTSASLMVRGAAAQEAARYARAHPKLSLGLHIDLGEWVFRNNEWIPLYEVVPADNARAVEIEAAKQLELFHELVGKNPTHIDSHQHCHRKEPVHGILTKIAGERDVPLRGFSKVNFCGRFYGQTAEGLAFPEGISIGHFLELMDQVPAGFTEIACHPGLDDQLDSVYRLERISEMKVLCDQKTRAAVRSRGITLCNYADYARLQKEG